MMAAALRSPQLKFVLRQEPRVVYIVWLFVLPAGDVHLWRAGVRHT